MQHIMRDRFVPVAPRHPTAAARPPRHARLFELIRQDEQAIAACPASRAPSNGCTDSDDTPLTAAKLAAFRDLACQSLRRR
ncbi:MAG: hypothetical protein OQK05_05985 [Pseudopelagicola sp.]|nr:hypothetical protein [Pseudopelagicola sp.]